MKEMEVKKRAWVKTAIIIFLAVMLVLTFFSNTIMNRSLPEVAARYTTSGAITARIRGTGTVAANELFEVVTNQTRTVSEVRVRLNSVVSTGDVLIVLTGSESEELEEANKALHEFELELERKLLEITRPDGALASANREIQRARNSLSEAQIALAQISFSQAALDQAQAAYNQALTAFNSAKATADARQLELSLAEAELKNFNTLNPPPFDPGDPDPFEAERTRLQVIVNNADTALINADFALGAAKATADGAQTTLDTQKGYKESWIIASAAVRQEQQALEDLVFSLSQVQAGANVDSSLEAIELRELRKQIEDKRVEIAELKKEGSSTEITALVSGVVKQVSISPGNQTEVGTPLLIIEVADRGYSLSIPVTAEQSRRVNVGDNAEVDRGWWSWGEEITAVLTSIRNDPENPVVGRLLEFSIRGDVESGTQLNVVLAQRTENYNVIVPNSALRSDTNGDFVLVVMSRSSPLGNRYIATRVDVNILASDDTNTAVSGALTGWDFVITTSTAPIDPGMQVRLVDNP